MPRGQPRPGANTVGEPPVGTLLFGARMIAPPSVGPALLLQYTSVSSTATQNGAGCPSAMADTLVPSLFARMTSPDDWFTQYTAVLSSDKPSGCPWADATLNSIDTSTLTGVTFPFVPKSVQKT